MNKSFCLSAVIFGLLMVNAVFAMQLVPLQAGQKYIYQQSDPCNNTWTVQMMANGQDAGFILTFRKLNGIIRSY